MNQLVEEKNIRKWKMENRIEDTEKPGRAWLEISLHGLRDNYRALLSKMPPGCDCMAVIKADAYGHGAIKVAEVLEEEGCGHFAVATLEEGIALRTAGIGGEILVLGYTMPRDAFLLKRYQLLQTVVDESHAAALAGTGCFLRTHLAVDTGMNRLGISCNDIDGIERVLKLPGLRVEGLYSHMSAADSDREEDRQFTLKQIEDFMGLKEKLGERDFFPAYHMQSSYGLLFYSMEGMTYARPGIALYGCASNSPKERLGLPLKPILSLKCRIACIRTVEAGGYVSYGRTWQAGKKCRLAVIAIGYADGLPRSLQQGYALVKGKKAPIVGRICMDQTILDVTGIPVKEGDIVTLIGKDGEEEIQAVSLAERAGSITNELLSRLGGRLAKIYIE